MADAGQRFQGKVVLVTGGSSGDAASYATGLSLILDGGFTAPFR
jgi:hypothetical protein